MSYAGDVDPSDAYAALQADADAVLVDVRTSAEWSYVGLPDLTQIGKRVIFLEWQRFPDGALNESFRGAAARGRRARGCPHLLPVSLGCAIGRRGGGCDGCRSRSGIQRLRRLRGPLDRDGHRTVAGWKAAGLPWRQG